MALTKEQVNDQYRAVLGRDANESEINDFLRFGEQGTESLSTEDIGRIIQGLPEARMSQLQKYGSMYGEELGKSDQNVLGQADDLIRSRFAQQGRQISSSPYLNAFANAARDLALARQQAVSGFVGQGLQGIYQGIGETADRTRSQGLQGIGNAANFGRDLQLYHQQKNDYNDYLNAFNRQQKRQAIGTALGAGFGAAAGGLVPGGSLAGARLGSGIGSSLGGLF